jgi:hypothetical protein
LKKPLKLNQLNQALRLLGSKMVRQPQPENTGFQ